MSWRLSEFRDALREELGEELYELVGDEAFDRWINAGQRKLGSYIQKSAAVTWAVGDSSAVLPSDLHHIEKFVPAPSYSGFPCGESWGGAYSFDQAATVAGSGTLRYYATRPEITGAADSTLTDEGNEALLSYALYRFFKRLSSSRADYRMYATISQANGVDINELEGISERHLQDFSDSAENLEPLRATTYYGD